MQHLQDTHTLQLLLTKVTILEKRLHHAGTHLAFNVRKRSGALLRKRKQPQLQKTPSICDDVELRSISTREVFT
ncbi:unnamed protein product [Parnassius apollo]|uniref:(apollo) hypothetical protein n=1 Tax=Parnassius apollo TaxID=110799 RepID=A0A8S3WBZ8_PARAO|nr:unnamed protein product [Parnassius apollo]